MDNNSPLWSVVFETLCVNKWCQEGEHLVASGVVCNIVPGAVLLTWGQVGEAVQGQALRIKAHFELQTHGLDQCLSEQPALLLPCDSTDTHT